MRIIKGFVDFGFKSNLLRVHSKSRTVEEGWQNDMAKMSVIKLMIQFKQKSIATFQIKATLLISGFRLAAFHISFILMRQRRNMEPARQVLVKKYDTDESPFPPFIRCLYRGLIIYCDSSSFSFLIVSRLDFKLYKVCGVGAC